MRCDQCQRDFANKSDLVRHKGKSCRGVKNTSKKRKINLPVLDNLGDGVERLQQAFQCRIATFRFRVKGECIDPFQFMCDVKQKVNHVLGDYNRNHHSVKVQSFDTVFVYKITFSIEQKRGTLNRQNQDSACFAWSINAAILPAKGDPTKPESYHHYSTLLIFDGVGFPIKLGDIHKFLQLNNISVNVVGQETYFKDRKMITELVGSFYHIASRQATHVNLLLTTDDN
ncbi:unnamed protein product [Diabrotica balteata]|uniref:C2H2-type domain-containing protein n=1 Tax=Diabrotica balteata TaxID=107213 RepID=A0A9N9SL53_DIABA|nr:unnamed protein product [Diabrotica balteata]